MPSHPRVQAQVVVLVREPRSIPVRAHVLLPLPVALVDVFLGVLERERQARRHARGQLGARRVAEHVQRVLARAEHPLRAAAHHHGRTCGHRLLDHVRGHLENPLLARRQRRRPAVEQLRRAECERVGDALHERRHPLLALHDLGHGHAEPLRNGVHELVVDELPAERGRDARGELGAAGADHPRYGDQRHV